MRAIAGPFWQARRGLASAALSCKPPRLVDPRIKKGRKKNPASAITSDSVRYARIFGICARMQRRGRSASTAACLFARSGSSTLPAAVTGRSEGTFYNMGFDRGRRGKGRDKRDG
ncbi:MAG: hypothetical protein KGM17_08935, partial [Sphingomonadales bacterium]|nr:hypothetical protein [Sphingomonadales bacterium]